ncbi:MAG: DUF6702 family protein [Vicinamibacterales bacterium]
MPRGPVAAVLTAVLVAAPAVLSAHKFYMSLTVVDHNAAERTLECTLRLFADDLEAAIARQGTALKHGQPGFDEAVFAYVRRTLVLTRADGTPVPLAWVGLENKVDVTWVYVEGRDVASTAGLRARDALFTELFPEQVNMLHLNDARGRRALDFREGDGFKPFP